MTWTWEQIETEWLKGGKIAISPGVAVEAFNRVECSLGPTWMTGCRGPTETAYGPAPTLGVISMGRRLAVLDGIPNTDQLLKKLRSGDHSASAELTALYLIRSGRPDIGVELEPELAVGGRIKKPDFCVRLPGNGHALVEVTQPNLSEEQRQAQTIITEIAGVIQNIDRPFALEVFLRRVPNEAETAAIKARLPTFCSYDGFHREDLGELGFLLLNHDRPGHIVLHDHDGEENRPRIGEARVIGRPDEPHRHVAVRLAFSDERAQQFLESEAKQLPKDAPGLIMVHMGNAPGAFRTWEPIIRRRFQPSLHTRVSAICLCDSGLEPTQDGEAWIPRSKLIVNPNAKHPLPDWINQQLGRYASDW
jgi:hypothetical protein